MALRLLKPRSNARLLSQSLKKYSTAGKMVAVEVNDKTGIATATLQRPPVNSLNLDLLSEISSTLSQLETNKCRGLILTSSSNSVFSAGLDILEMYKPNPERMVKFWTTLQDTWLKLYGSSYPTVAVINGHSPAGGCLLAISCEYRIMLNNFTIGLNETQLGIIAPKWFMASYVNTLGRRQAELALTTGCLFKTEEALKVGLVDETASSKEEGLAKAEAFLQKFARIPPAARGITKKSFREKDIQDLVENREQDLKQFVGVVTQNKVQQGLELYLESLKKKQNK